MTIINCTPHAVAVLPPADGPGRTYPPSGQLARCAVTRRVVDEVDGALVTESVFGTVEGLPPPTPGTFFIVSRVVAEAARDRTDLLITDDTVRDGEGRIIGCRAFARIRS